MRRIAIAIVTLAAWAGQAVAQVPPSPEALVERFIAALPRPSMDRDARDLAEAVQHLRSLNPGAPEADVQAAAAEAEACFGRLALARTYAMLRNVGRQLGEARVRRLIAFYEGPDHVRFSQLGDAADRGALTEAERAERLRIMAAYPFADFASMSAAAIQALPTDPAFEREQRQCQAIGAAAVARRGLRG